MTSEQVLDASAQTNIQHTATKVTFRTVSYTHLEGRCKEVMRENKDYLITEKPSRALLIFSIPMIIGNLFQQAYTIVDSAT